MTALPDLFKKLNQCLIPLKSLGEVYLFVKNVGSAGFKVVSDSSDGLPYLNTSDYRYLELPSTWKIRLVKDLTSVGKERFIPRLGDLLLVRRTGICSTLKVTAIVPNVKATGTMWLPVALRPCLTKNGDKLGVDEVRRLCALWLQSTPGFLLLLAEREETTGEWNEWKTEKAKTIPVLNPQALTFEAIKRILDIWSKIRHIEWENMLSQFEKARNDPSHPRRLLDDAICDGLDFAMPDELYTHVLEELRFLTRVMPRKTP